MPQLAKGGKYVFGISHVGEEYLIHIPPEAFDEYELHTSNKIVLCSGSVTSGGFGCMSPRRLADSPLNEILRILCYKPETGEFDCPENEIFRYKNGLFTWTGISDKGVLRLSRELSNRMRINAGDKLVVVRGGRLGPSLLSRGPLHQLAMKYDGLPEL